MKYQIDSREVPTDEWTQAHALPLADNDRDFGIWTSHLTSTRKNYVCILIRDARHYAFRVRYSGRIIFMHPIGTLAPNGGVTGWEFAGLAEDEAAVVEVLATDEPNFGVDYAAKEFREPDMSVWEEGLADLEM